MKVRHSSHKSTNKPVISSMQSHWSHGINRRDFIKSSLAVSLLASLTGCKPSAEQRPFADIPLINTSTEVVKLDGYTFTNQQHIDLQAIYMRLFPDDGDGPSANDLNVLTYLEWAMTDERNINDGDPAFIAKGIGWLNQYAQDEYGDDFIDLSPDQQDNLIEKTSRSDSGRNWLSLLTYYLVEALTLDPYYGGNTNQVGWQWLEYQGGFPNPVAGKTYRDFS